MKKLKYNLIGLLILNIFNHQTQTEFIAFTDFESIKTKSICRLMLLPSLVAIAGYIHKDAITKTLTDNPLTSLLWFYVITNYIIDSVYEYQSFNSILKVLQSAEKINLYILCTIMLRKNISLSKKNSILITEQMVSEKIHEYSGFYINEIEEITAQFNKKALEYLGKFNVLHFNVEFACIENIVTKECIPLSQVISPFKKDSELYSELLAIEKNEDIDVEKILKTIGLRIKDEIQILIQKM